MEYTYKYNIKMRASLLAVMGIFCFSSAPLKAYAGGVDMGCSPTVANPCSGGGSSGVGGYTGGGLLDQLWDGLFNSGPAAADIADQQARLANVQGVEAYKRGDWATAAAYFTQALQNYPNDPTYHQNLINAENNMANQQAREKAEREAMERQRQNKVAADNMQHSIQNFAQTLNAAPVSGGLDFDGRTSGNAPEGNSVGLDFTATVTPPGKSTTTLSFGDPMVVDARNVSSSLPKGLDDTIANAYLTSPPGVSDRVRKGFQAVMERDWKVAKAWFQDALKRDPTNVGLKRLVALTDSSQHVDTRNEPAGLGGTPDAKSVGKQASQAQPTSVSKADPNLQLPDADDIRFLFPGLQKMKGGEAPVFTTLPNGRRVQMPQDSDMEYLFGTQAAPKATPTYIIGKNGQLVQVPENSDQESTTYIKGKDGKLMAVPQPKDANLFMFPGNSPAATSNPAVESGKTK